MTYACLGTKRFDSEKAGDREVQRTMLELLNQLDGFSSTTDIKVNQHFGLCHLLIDPFKPNLSRLLPPQTALIFWILHYSVLVVWIVKLSSLTPMKKRVLELCKSIPVK